MHCQNCDRLLSEYESTVKNAITFEYMDLCKVCLEDVRPFTKLIDRKDLISEADLDEVEDFDGDLDTRPSLEDFEDLIDTIENYKGDYDV